MTDPQDPLPEPQWLFRRFFVWILAFAAMAVVGWIVGRRADADVTQIALWLIGLVALLATFYLLAPSAEQLAKLLAAWPRLRLPGSKPPEESA